MLNLIKTKFKFAERKTNFKTEIIGGLITFAAMLYILPVNASILANAKGSGMPYQGVFIATAIVAALSTMAVGLFSNLPIAMAPGMGSNAFFSYTICHEFGLPWQAALSVVILNGIVFTILAVSGLATKFITYIPKQLKIAITTGLGLFIAYIGLTGSGIVNETNGLSFGGFSDINVVLATIGILSVFALNMFKKIKGFSILITMVGLVAISMVIGQIWPSTGLVRFTDISFDFSKYGEFTNVAGQGVTHFGDALSEPRAYFSIMGLLFMALAGAAGTILAVGQATELIDEEGKVPGEKTVVIINGIASASSGVAGSSPSGGFLESLTGVEAGARTGFSVIFTGFLFLLSIPLFPLFEPFSQSFVTAPALIYVGAMMFTGIKNLKMDEYVGMISSFVLILIMIFTSNLLTGFAYGFITYIVLSLLSGKAKEVSIITYGTAAFFTVYLILLEVI